MTVYVALSFDEAEGFFEGLFGSEMEAKAAAIGTSRPLAVEEWGFEAPDRWHKIREWKFLGDGKWTRPIY